MISPTLACMDYLNIGENIREMDQAGVDFYHIDIMDGHYVQNLCLNFDMVTQIRSISSTPMDVHLMVKNPMEYVDRLSRIGVEYACCHLDACSDPAVFLQALKERGIRAGLVLSPEETKEAILPYAKMLDYVVVMFVRPGFSGQKFNPGMLDKIRDLDRLRTKMGLSFLIEGDGGIGWDNIGDLVEAGTDISVAGVFAVFGQTQGLFESCRDFRQLARSLQERKDKGA